MDQKCWHCGKTILNPSLWVEEGMFDYGVYTGYRRTAPIHKACADKCKQEGLHLNYKWRVVAD